MNSKETQLKTLRLGGFQVFADIAEIPVAPITLLYGPNSVGKSALHDALGLLHRFWKKLPADADAYTWEFASAATRKIALTKDWYRCHRPAYRIQSVTGVMDPFCDRRIGSIS